MVKTEVKNDLEFYDENADNWWDEKSKIYALYHLNKPRFEFFDRHATNWQGLKTLDVGCGGGFSCEFMAERGAIVSGIDQSEKCVQAAKNHAAISGFEINYRQGLAENMPYDDNTFDVVICVDVLEHVADYKQVVSEVHRILKPGGLFFFDTINRTFSSQVVMIGLMENILGDLGLEIFPEVQMLKYHCGCTFDRMTVALKMLGRPELEDMLAKDKGAEVTCDFCNNIYQLNEKQLANLITELL